MEFCSQMKQCCTQKKSYLNNSLGKILISLKSPLEKSHFSQNSLEKIPKPATLLYLQH